MLDLFRRRKTEQGLKISIAQWREETAHRLSEGALSAGQGAQ